MISAACSNHPGEVTLLLRWLRQLPLCGLVVRGHFASQSVLYEIALLFYNKDLFDKAGLPYPPAKVEDAWTWDEFVSVAKKLTKDRNGNTAESPSFDPSRIATYGINLYQNNLIFEILMWSNGAGIISRFFTLSKAMPLFRYRHYSKKNNKPLR